MKTHETLAQQEFVARQLRRRQMVVLARLFLFLSVLSSGRPAPGPV